MGWKSTMIAFFVLWTARPARAGTADSTQGMLSYAVLILFLLLLLFLTTGLERLRKWLPTGGFEISFS